MRSDPYVIGDDAAAALLTGMPWARFAAVGDSGAAGETEAFEGYRTRSWFDQVAEWLRMARFALVARNFGRRDVRAAEVRAWQLGPALEFEPDLAAVLSGGNDLLQRDFDPGATGDEIAKVVGALREAGATVLMTGLFDITVSPYVEERYRKVMSERIARLTAVIREIATAHDAVYVDLPNHPAATEAIYSSDGLHLNARGQAILATEVARALSLRAGLAGPGR
ncbi:SGNH/GDSL hydrolase family protein [Streptosporangiaceae bacterium NEAU-GS5]|nr:SGNH/GDSL hydrolase family protein [Streptosporangiaceae bacterium NEAU-GS5]